jgi:polyisoprenoid-binding protein YceI
MEIAVGETTGTWELNPIRSRLEFRVRHLGIVEVVGHFTARIGRGGR